MMMVGQFRWHDIPTGPNGLRFAATLAGLAILILWALGRVGVRVNASPSLPSASMSLPRTLAVRWWSSAPTDRQLLSASAAGIVLLGVVLMGQRRC
jgi:hypothetical protein